LCLLAPQRVIRRVLSNAAKRRAKQRSSLARRMEAGKLWRWYLGLFEGAEPAWEDPRVRHRVRVVGAVYAFGAIYLVTVGAWAFSHT
jgi:hypothetical protein